MPQIKTTIQVPISSPTIGTKFWTTSRSMPALGVRKALLGSGLELLARAAWPAVPIHIRLTTSQLATQRIRLCIIDLLSEWAAASEDGQESASSHNVHCLTHSALCCCRRAGGDSNPL